MTELEQDLGFRIDSALQAVAVLDRTLTDVARDAGERLGAELARGVRVDASPVTTEIDTAFAATDAAPVQATLEAAVQDADKTAEIEPDAEAVAPSVEGAIAEADRTATVEPDASQVLPAIEIAVADADKTAVIEAEAPDIPEVIEAGIAEADKTVTIEVDTVGAERDLSGVSGSADDAADELANMGAAAVQAGSGLDVAGNAATITSGTIAVLQGNFGGLASKAGPLGAAIAGVATATGIFVNEASQARDVTERFNRTLGSSATQIDHIDVGGLNVDLSELAIKLGASDDNLRQVATDLGVLGQTSGASATQIATTAEQVLGLSANVAALHPELGTMDQIAGQLPGALARGGKAAAALGIDLDGAAVKARAAEIALAAGREEVTRFDLVTAGAELTTRKFGTSIADNVEQGSKQVGVQLRSMRTEISETIEELGEPLVEPVVEAFRAVTPVIAATVKVIGRALVELTPAIESVANALALLEPGFEALNNVMAESSRQSQQAQTSHSGLDVTIRSLNNTAGVGAAVLETFGLKTGRLTEEAEKAFPAFTQVTDAVGGIAQSISDAIPIVETFATVALVDLTEEMEKSREATDKLEAEVVGALPGISSAFDQVAKDGKASMEELRKALIDQFIAESQFFANLKIIVQQGGHDVADAIRAQGPERGAALAEAVAKSTPALIAQLEFQADQVTTLEREFGHEWATAAAQGFADGILKAVPIMDGATVQAVQKVSTTGKNVLGIRSPSRVFAEMGEQVGAGLALGIRTSLPEVGRAIGELERFTVGGSAGTLNVTAGGAVTGGPVSQTINVFGAEDPEATAQRVSLRVLQGATR